MTALLPFPYDALLCDVDNVIRRYDNAALTAAEAAAGVPAGTTSRVAFAAEVAGPLVLGQVTPQEWTRGVAAAFVRTHADVPYDAALGLARALVASPFAVDADVVAVLRAVRDHATLVLVTNASVQLEADLVQLGLTDLAHHVVSSARVGVAKPDPRIYTIAADRAQAAPERCLFVDDTPANVDAARELGMAAVHFRTCADLRAAVRTLLPDSAA